MASTRKGTRRAKRPRADAPAQTAADDLIGGAADYSIGPLIGFGLLGPVRRGRYLPTGAPVELEGVPAHLRTSVAFMQRLGELSRTAALLHDAHLVAVYDLLLEAGGTVYVVTGAPDADSLATTCPDGQGLEPAEMVGLADAVLAALAVVHDAGLAHGGLSRRLLLSGSDGVVRLSGVPVAMALAEHQGREPSREADLAAVSELLLGLAEQPLLGHSRRRAAPRALRQTLRRRYESAAEMRGAIDPGEAPAAVPTGPPPARARPLRRWATLLAMGGAAAAAGVGLGLAVNSTLLPSSPAGSLAVRSVSIDVRPSGTACDPTFHLTALGSVSGAGELVYRWAASGGRASANRTLRVDPGSHSFTVTQDWRPPAADSQASISFEILQPASLVITRAVNTRCP